MPRLKRSPPPVASFIQYARQDSNLRKLPNLGSAFQPLIRRLPFRSATGVESSYLCFADHVTANEKIPDGFFFQTTAWLIHEPTSRSLGSMPWDSARIGVTYHVEFATNTFARRTGVRSQYQHPSMQRGSRLKYVVTTGADPRCFQFGRRHSRDPSSRRSSCRPLQG